MSALPETDRLWSAGLRDPKVWAVSLLVAIGVAVLMAIPTAILENPWFTRMTPVMGEQYFFWIATSIVMGLLAGTFAVGAPISRRGSGGGVGAGLLTTLAIGCPICNKLVVALLGVSGAISYFGPVQPLLGAAGLLLAAAALAVRVRDLRVGACRVEPATSS